jgi:hypothetical protein
MEADWEFEVGGEGPVIEALWPGFVDLRRSPELIDELPETAEIPALAVPLVKLNAKTSPVWTSKCGVWTENYPESFDSGRLDPDEFDAPTGYMGHTIGFYIDLLPKRIEQWPSPDMVAASCKVWCKQFRTVQLRCCRVDLVVRRAFITLGHFDLGVTAYLTACGESANGAKAVLEKATSPFTDVLCGHSTVQ